MSDIDYSRAALIQFTDLLASKGLANSNTAGAMKSAVSRILSDLSPEEESDVRKIDVALAIRRYNNKNPTALSPASLAEYQRRVVKAIAEFQRYTDSPTTYNGVSGAPRLSRSDRNDRPAVKKTAALPEARHDVGRRPEPAMPLATSAPPGLTLAFPLRPDFLAQVVLPRDLKTDEAKRLAAFIATLAIDYAPA